MKKVISLFLVLVLLVSLCSCGNKEADETDMKSPDAPLVLEKKPDSESSSVPEKAEIKISDLCDLSGRCLDGYGWTGSYSYRLPEISGPDSAYLKGVRNEIDGIYTEYIASQIESMQDGTGFDYETCGYRYAENDGIHSLCICVTTDWAFEYYWCYNFDAEGNEVGNDRILKAAGLTEEKFVSALRDYLEVFLDCSDFLEPDEWEEYQATIIASTLAEDNCNADIPMYLNEEGNLCCIERIFSIAGADSYLYELEFQKDGTIREYIKRGAFLNRLVCSGYSFPAADDEYSEYYIRIFNIVDDLVLEGCYRDLESGDVYSYFAAEMIPDNRADLFRNDIDSMRFTFNSYSVSSFGGAYSGESSVYTLKLTDDGIMLTDYEGSVPLLGNGEDLEGTYDWSDSDYAYEYFDWASMDYDLMYRAGLSGNWSGYYYDENYITHSVTMQLTEFGSMLIRDISENSIPRILEGYYKVVGAEDGPFPEGSVSFTLTRTGDYKMPIFGCCGMMIDDEGTLLIYNLEDNEDFDYLFLPYEDGNAVFERVPSVSQVREKQVISLNEDPVAVDIDLDGTKESISFSYEENEYEIIENLIITLDDTDYYCECWIYGVKAYLMIPDLSGVCYVIVDGLTDNDYHYLTMFTIIPDNVIFSGEWDGGLHAMPETPDRFSIQKTMQLISTAGVTRTYSLGTSGLPEPIEPYFYVLGGPELKLKQDLEVWETDPESGELLDFYTLPEGTACKLFRTDGQSLYDIQTKDGRSFRLWVYYGYNGQEIDGYPIEDLFDGIIFAG